MEYTSKKGGLFKRMKAQTALFVMIIPCMIYTFIFSYLPLQGWIMAFQNFKPRLGYAKSPMTGFDQFKFLFDTPEFWTSLRNTLGMSSMNLVFGFLFSITFALLLNEIKFTKFKKLTQTVSYLPHFLSWVIVCSLISNILSSSDGALNNILMAIGIIDKPVLWLGEVKMFWWVVAFSNVWKEMGWDSIIYIAAISGIDVALYEAAEIDGANRYQKMWHVTLPGISSTVVVIMIMKLGWILNAGFEVQYLLGGGLVQSVSQTLEIFELKYGLGISNYSLATAAGILKSTVSILLVSLTTLIASKVSDDSIL